MLACFYIWALYYSAVIQQDKKRLDKREAIIIYRCMHIKYDWLVPTELRHKWSWAGQVSNLYKTDISILTGEQVTAFGQQSLSRRQSKKSLIEMRLCNNKFSENTELLNKEATEKHFKWKKRECRIRKTYTIPYISIQIYMYM